MLGATQSRAAWAATVTTRGRRPATPQPSHFETRESSRPGLRAGRSRNRALGAATALKHVAAVQTVGKRTSNRVPYSWVVAGWPGDSGARLQDALDLAVLRQRCGRRNELRESDGGPTLGPGRLDRETGEGRQRCARDCWLRRSFDHEPGNRLVGGPRFQTAEKYSIRFPDPTPRRRILRQQQSHIPPV